MSALFTAAPIGRLAIGRARIGRLEIDELAARRLTPGEKVKTIVKIHKEETMLHRCVSLCLAVAAGLAAANPTFAESDYDELNGIHTIGIVSLLGNELNDPDQKSAPIAEVRRAIGNYFDQRIRDYIIKAVGNRFIVKEVDSSIFSDLRGSQWTSEWAKIGDRLHDTAQKPDVDAVVVVYVDEASSILWPPGIGALNEKHMLFGFGKDITDVEVTYGVGVYNAKTGERLDYGTGRWPSHGSLTGYAPPFESCDGSMLSESSDQPGSDRISKEIWSLLTRSLPYALLNSGLISKQDADALIASAAPADPSCHAP